MNFNNFGSKSLRKPESRVLARIRPYLEKQWIIIRIPGISGHLRKSDLALSSTRELEREEEAALERFFSFQPHEDNQTSQYCRCKNQICPYRRERQGNKGKAATHDGR